MLKLKSIALAFKEEFSVAQITTKHCWESTFINEEEGRFILEVIIVCFFFVVKIKPISSCLSELFTRKDLLKAFKKLWFSWIRDTFEPKAAYFLNLSQNWTVHKLFDEISMSSIVKKVNKLHIRFFCWMVLNPIFQQRILILLLQASFSSLCECKNEAVKHWSLINDFLSCLLMFMVFEQGKVFLCVCDFFRFESIFQICEKLPFVQIIEIRRFNIRKIVRILISLLFEEINSKSWYILVIFIVNCLNEGFSSRLTFLNSLELKFLSLKGRSSKWNMRFSILE